MLVLCNPTSCEIYREVLPEEQIDPASDELSRPQRDVPGRYAQTKGLGFCDFTASFRNEVGSGARGPLGRTDGTPWSQAGTRIAGTVLTECLQRFARQPGSEDR